MNRSQRIVLTLHWLLIVYCGILAACLLVAALWRWIPWRYALPAALALCLGAWIFRPKQTLP